MRYLIALILLWPLSSFAQLRWQNVDSAFGPLPPTIHVYFSESRLDTAPFRAYYLTADLKDSAFFLLLIPLIKGVLHRPVFTKKIHSQWWW